jgi:hypothetical protein
MTDACFLDDFFYLFLYVIFVRIILIIFIWIPATSNNCKRERWRGIFVRDGYGYEDCKLIVVQPLPGPPAPIKAYAGLIIPLTEIIGTDLANG